MSKHERWGRLCHFCEESWPCETVTLRTKNARLRESLNEACDWLKRLQEAYDPTDTEDGIVEIERLRKGGEGQ